jgi:hypothetical protein
MDVATNSVPAIWQVWAVSAVLLLVSAGLPGVLNDFDTFWHVASGQVMLDTYAIPDRDPFSHTMQGEPWMVHEWLAQIIFASVYTVGGWPLVALVPALMLAATVVIIAISVARHLSALHTAMLCLLAVIMALPHLLARPHVLAWPVMAWWTAELVRAADKERSPPWWLLLVMVMWANLHGSFVLGLGLFGLLAGEVTVKQWRRDRRFTLPWGWVLFGALALVASTLTPHGLDKIFYVFTVMGQEVQLSLIGEWRSPDFQSFSPLQLWLFLSLAAALCLGLRLPWTRVLIVLVLLHLALRHQRYIELVGFLTPIFVAAPLGPQLRALAGPQAGSLAALFSGWLRPLPTAAIVTVTALVVTFSTYTMRNIEPGKATPEAALAAVRAAGIEGPVLNHHDFGGYLIHAGVPTFIDGRSDLFGDKFLMDYHEAQSLTAAEALPRLLEAHAIEWTLLTPRTSAVTLLDRLEGWRRLYADDTAVVHVRSEAMRAAAAIR